MTVAERVARAILRCAGPEADTPAAVEFATREVQALIEAATADLRAQVAALSPPPEFEEGANIGFALGVEDCRKKVAEAEARGMDMAMNVIRNMILAQNYGPSRDPDAILAKALQGITARAIKKGE